MLDQNLIALPDVLGPLQQLDRHSRQNDLFISRGPTKTNFALEHAGKGKKIISACPEKNSNPFPSWILVESIAAPYGVSVAHPKRAAKAPEDWRSPKPGGLPSRVSLKVDASYSTPKLGTGSFIRSTRNHFAQRE